MQNCGHPKKHLTHTKRKNFIFFSSDDKERGRDGEKNGFASVDFAGTQTNQINPKKTQKKTDRHMI